MSNLLKLNCSATLEPETKRFSILAYTGDKMRVSVFSIPIVINLSNVKLRSPLPILLNHDDSVENIVGQAEKAEIRDNQLFLTGSILNEDSPKIQNMLNLAKKGFSWGASVGAIPLRISYLKKDNIINLNGRNFTGPLTIIDAAEIIETSFVPVPADGGTQTTIFGELNMSDTINLEELEKVKADYEAASTKIKALAKICAEHPDLLEKAIDEDWSEDKARLEVLKAKRPVISTTTKNTFDNAKVIEASLCRSAGLQESFITKHYGPETTELSASKDYRDFGLHGLMYAVLKAAGFSLPFSRVNSSVIERAFEADRKIRAEGYSTLSLPGILSNVANKTLLAGFEAVDRVAPMITAATSVSDFKTVTRYRLTGKGLFEEVGPAGELPHGDLGEESYTNQAKTFGRMLTVTRNMLINDDLSALAAIPRLLGRQAALKLEEDVFKLLLSNPGNFFHASNNNLINNPLSVAGLTAADIKFAKFVDLDGKPILVSPAKLLVPPELKATAQQLLVSVRLLGPTDTQAPEANVFAGRYMLLVSPYLSGSLNGASATQWYLMARPEDVAMMEVAYLNGQQTPVIESGEMDFNTLGVGFRAYWDYGVAMVDPRAAVKSTGV